MHGVKIAGELPSKNAGSSWLDRLLSRSRALSAAIVAAVIGWAVVDGLILGNKTVRLACGLLPESLSDLSDFCPRRTPSDPRRILVTEMGIAWDEDNFWKAVSRGDDRAVSLFLRGGMIVDARKLHELLSDQTLTRRASLKQLGEHGASFGAEFCSSDSGTSPTPLLGKTNLSAERFAEYSRDEFALRFVRRFCEGRGISVQLKHRLQRELERLETLQVKNQKLLEARRACVSEVASAYRHKSGKLYPALLGALFDAQTCADNAFPPGVLRGYCEVNLNAMNARCPQRKGCSVEAVTAEDYCAARLPAETADESLKKELEFALVAYQPQ